MDGESNQGPPGNVGARLSQLRLGRGEILGTALLVKGSRVLDGNNLQMSPTGFGGRRQEKQMHEMKSRETGGKCNI